MGRVLALALVALLTLPALLVHAQGGYRDTARAGVSAFNDGDLETAIARFEEARAIRATPRIHRLLGRAQLAAGQPVAAARSLSRALSVEDEEFPLSDAMREEINADLLPRALAGATRVQLTGVPDDAEVRVDGSEAERFDDGLLLEPGAHSVSVAGLVPDPHVVEAEAGATVSLAFEPTAANDVVVTEPVTVDAEGDSGLLVPGLALLIGGVVVAGAGGALLGIGWEAAARVQAADFYPDVAADDDLARWMTPAGIAALAAGGALAAIGIVLMALPSGSEDTAELRLGPGQLILAGTFQ
ncbi:MAG: hypothetical protein AB8I08_13860 [Sandaracinaceae bacterium]